MADFYNYDTLLTLKCDLITDNRTLTLIELISLIATAEVINYALSLPITSAIKESLTEILNSIYDVRKINNSIKTVKINNGVF